MRLALCPAFLLLATLRPCTGPADQAAAKAQNTASPAQRAALLTAPYAGEYNWGDTTRKEAGGTLYVYPESDLTVLLALDMRLFRVAWFSGTSSC